MKKHTWYIIMLFFVLQSNSHRYIQEYIIRVVIYICIITNIYLFKPSHTYIEKNIESFIYNLNMQFMQVRVKFQIFMRAQQYYYIIYSTYLEMKWIYVPKKNMSFKHFWILLTILQQLIHNTCPCKLLEYINHVSHFFATKWISHWLKHI